MEIIVWVVLGAIAGWIASLIAGTDAQQGAVGNVVVGIVGALLGGFVMNLFGQGGVSGFNLYSLMVAIIGSVLVLYIYRSLSHKQV
ncbi:MAG: GlsB/YeaQ/YmgE family stress response membrane protein [Candidatus Saccharimonadales bacterium]